MAKARKKRKRLDSGGDYEKLDLWDKQPVPKRRHKERLEVEMISDDAIERGSSLGGTKLKAFRTLLAADGRDNFCEVVVLSVDIRNSSITLINVEDFAEYHRGLADFICYTKDSWLAKPGRFFDKFTGDGALFFWPLPEQPIKEDEDRKVTNSDKTLIDYYYDVWNQRIKQAVDFGIEMTCKFMEVFVPSIRKTGGLIPKGFGLSIGIDAGRCFLTQLKSSTEDEAGEDRYDKHYGAVRFPDNISDSGVSEEPTITVSNNVTVLGRPVIGATRMVDAAEPYEMLVNCYPGAALKAMIDDPRELEIHKDLFFGLELDFRHVKEYCHGPVEVYRVTTDRIEHLKRELGLVEEDEEGSEEGKKETKEFICKPTKSKHKPTK